MSQPAYRILIWGGAGHAKVIREAITPLGHSVCGVIDTFDVPPPFDDVPLFSGTGALDEWLRATECPQEVRFVVAIGGSRGRERMELHSQLREAGLEAFTTMHPRAFVAAGARCAPGSQVLAMASVCEGASIGLETIVNTAASLDHESIAGDGVHIGPGAHVAGLVEIQDFVTIGTGATILPRIRIGSGSTVGAGAVVTKHVPEGVTVVGIPAQILRSTDER